VLSIHDAPTIDVAAPPAPKVSPKMSERPKIKLTEEQKRMNVLAVKSQAKLDADYKTRCGQPGSMTKAFNEQFDRIKSAAQR
jgi:hypothetical protein